jgi:hypothetical protein
MTRGKHWSVNFRFMCLTSLALRIRRRHTREHSHMGRSANGRSAVCERASRRSPFKAVGPAQLETPGPARNSIVRFQVLDRRHLQMNHVVSRGSEEFVPTTAPRTRFHKHLVSLRPPSPRCATRILTYPIYAVPESTATHVPPSSPRGRSLKVPPHYSHSDPCA